MKGLPDPYPPLLSHLLSAHREHDPESGLVHMRARMYEPRVGRFTQMDPVLANRPIKRYEYAANDPVTNKDPRGEDEFRIVRDPESGLQIVQYVNEGIFWIEDDPVNVGIYEGKTESVMLMKEGSPIVSVPFNVLKRGLRGILFDTGPSTTEGWYDWAKGWRESQKETAYTRPETLVALHQELVRPPNWENQYQGFVQAVRDAGVELAIDLLPAGKATHGFAAFLGIARKAKQAKRAASIVKTAEKAVIKHRDHISQLALRHDSLTSGSKKLRAAGLIERLREDGSHVFLDPKTGRQRARWDPKNVGGCNHWHKYAPDGETPINDVGHVVEAIETRAHIPSK
ncbi:MAG: RHS repeat-associated core domain-containing protein [candidate division WOR-3 bacterium]